MSLSEKYPYEGRLEELSSEELCLMLRKLRKEISRLRFILEEPECLRREKSRAVGDEEERLRYAWRWLDRVKAVFLARNSVADLPLRERKVTRFEQSMDTIFCLTFRRISYMLFDTDYVRIYIEPDGVRIVDRDREGDYKSPLSRQELLDKLRELHLAEWEKEYRPEPYGYSIFDGTEWTLKVSYSNRQAEDVFRGSNVYPYGFDELLTLFGLKRTYGGADPFGKCWLPF